MPLTLNKFYDNKNLKSILKKIFLIILKIQSNFIYVLFIFLIFNIIRMTLGLSIQNKIIINKNIMKKTFFFLIIFSFLSISLQLVPFKDFAINVNTFVARFFKDNSHLLDITNTCPYVSSGCFFFHSNFVYVEHFKNVEPKRLNDGDLVFVKTNLLEEFFNKIFKKINKKIILISHHDDDPTNKGHEIYLKNDSKLIAWYSTNPGFFHKKHIPIPLGLQSNYLEGFKFTHRTLHTAFKLMFDFYIKDEDRVKHIRSLNLNKLIPWHKRKYTMYVNFYVHKKLPNEPDPGNRRRLRNAFKNFTNIYDAVREDYFSYMKSLGNSKFVICPQGLLEFISYLMINTVGKF